MRRNDVSLDTPSLQAARNLSRQIGVPVDQAANILIDIAAHLMETGQLQFVNDDQLPVCLQLGDIELPVSDTGINKLDKIPKDN